MGRRATRTTGSGAYVLADVLRTDRARLRPLIPDGPAPATLRQACRARKDLVRHRVAVGNQLRAHLLCAFPAAAGLFCKLHSAISLAFLARFDCQDRADWLSEKRLAAWLKGQGYCGRKDPAELHARLAGAPAAPPATTVPPRRTSPAPSSPSWPASCTRSRP